MYITRVNNPTLWDFCVSMIGRADIEGSKSSIAMNAWLPQASYPCGNLSDTSSWTFLRPEGSIEDVDISLCRRGGGRHVCSTPEERRGNRRFCLSSLLERCPVRRHPLGKTPLGSSRRPCGQFLKVQVLNVLPEPGALNSCRHTLPKINAGLAMVIHIIPCTRMN